MYIFVELNTELMSCEEIRKSKKDAQNLIAQANYQLSLFKEGMEIAYEIASNRE